MKVAIYTDLDRKYPSITVYEAKNWIEKHDSYVRISEIVEVDFPMLGTDINAVVRAKATLAARAALKKAQGVMADLELSE